MQWRKKRRVLYVIGSAHHPLLIKQYREDGCNGVCSNEDEADGDRDSISPLNNSGTSGTSYARASAQSRVPRTKPSTASSRGGSYNYRHRSYYQQPHDSHQPLVTTEKKTFNEEEYTKITTPRQDVLFKKGYLGRKRPTAVPTADITATANNSSTNPENTAADVANGNLSVNGTADHNGEAIENDHTPSSDVMSPVEEQPQYIYATNGYVDQTGGPPPGLYYINGSGYELYDPYSGNVTVVVGPAPHYGGPGGGPPVLAAVPCQPLPLQPLEWFNPAFLPYVTAPCHNGLTSARERRKRHSADSQNCSPQSSESTEPPGSPQECEMDVTQAGEQPGPAMYTQAPAYVYPGYMFGPPMYSVNGLTVQGAPTQPPSCDASESNKRRKKKRRRRRRRGGTEDGCSEESSSDEKELEEPMSVTSQESSSQEIESDSKQSINTTALNNDSSSSSPLSSCQTLTPTDHTETIRISSSVVTPALAAEQSSHPNAFESEISTNEIPPTVNTSSPIEQEYISAPSLQIQDVKDTCSGQFNQEYDKTTKDNSDYLTNVQLLKDQAEPELKSQSTSCTSTYNSLQHAESIQLAADSKDIPSAPGQYSSYDIVLTAQSNDYETHSPLSTRITSPEQSSLESTVPFESGSQCNGVITSSVSSENCNKTEEIAKPSKQKKSNKQSNSKSKKNSKGKEEKQQKRPKASVVSSNTDINQKQNNKKKENSKKDAQEGNEISEIAQVNSSSQPKSSINGIPSDISTQVEHITHEVENQDSSEKNSQKGNELTNGCYGESNIPSVVAKDIRKVDMEGNEEKKCSPVTQEPLHSEERMQGSGSSSSHSDESNKRDLFPQFMTSLKEPPTRPVRKEKRKSSPSLVPPLEDSDETPKTNVAAKPFELPPISLRPDVPKSEPKALHEATSTQQLKGTADILESITAALTREPEVALQELAHTDSLAYQKPELPLSVLNEVSAETQLLVGSPVSQEGQILSVESLEKEESAHSATQIITSKTKGDIIGDKPTYSLGNESISISELNNELMQIEDVLPPVPPPRGRKHNALMKHKLAEHSQAQSWELESGNITDESSGDSTTSTTHESEESVIELLSSTHTSPDDKPKQSLSSDEEEDIIFRAEKSEGTDEIVDIKSIPPDKSDVCTPSISGPSLQYSSQISNIDKSTISKTPPVPTAKEQMSLDLQGHLRGAKAVHSQHAEIYADGLSKKIVLEAVSESSKKRTTLPITEAVTRWLRSQSPEVLSLPPPEDETESEISSEDQEQDEKAENACQNQNSTGQKNVLCNPLPVPLLEDCHHLSVNKVNHSGHNDRTGRRVALNDVFFEHNHECISEKHDNNGTSVSISKVEGEKRLKNELDDEDSNSFYKNNCISTSLKINSNSKLDSCNNVTNALDGESVINQCPNNYTGNRNCSCEHTSCRTSENIPNKYTCGNTEIGSLNEEKQQYNMKTTEENIIENTSVEFYNTSSALPGPVKNNSVNGTNKTDERNKSEDEFSFTSEDTLDCEWDLWDCNPVKPPPPSNMPKNPTVTPTEEILAKSPDDYCSHMCDPAVSVAKYYSLGALQKKSVMFDEDSIDSSDEEVDALKHFQHELEDDDDGLQTSSTSLPSSRSQESEKKLTQEMNENKVYGNPEIYKSVYGEAGPRKCIEENHDQSQNVYNAALSQRAQAAHLFHRKSSVLVSRLKGDGPFPCGGICCILQ